MPILTLNFSRSRWIAATIFPSEGVTGSVRSLSARFIEKVWVQRFVSFSDNELAMWALKVAAARSLPLVEATTESCPVGDHRANDSK